VKTERKSVSSAHKLDGLGKLKEHAPRSEHVQLHQDIGHIRKNHLHATLLPQLSMVTMVTIGGDLQPGCLADRLLTGLGQPQINP